MHADLTRDSFVPANRFTRVVLQQGRLLVDADWNEQTDILLTALRTLTADLIGWHGGVGVEKNTADGSPSTGPLKVTVTGSNNAVVVLADTVAVARHYYVDGLAVQPTPDGLKPIDRNKADPAIKNRLVYLDVWESQVSPRLTPDLLDPAFGGLDTAVRTRLESQVRVLYTDLTDTSSELKDPTQFRSILVKTPAGGGPVKLDNRTVPTLTADVKDPDDTDPAPCETPTGGYTGLENQLYRVEVHTGGATVWDGNSPPTGSLVTFKWSRDNGSVAYPVETLTPGASPELTVSATRWDDARAIKEGQWIELLAAGEAAGVLVRAGKVRRADCVVTVPFTVPTDPAQPNAVVPLPDPTKPGIVVRRWDHGGTADLYHGAVLARTNVKLPLEDGVTIQFTAAGPGTTEYRPGDYWLIPARAVTGDLLGPIVNANARHTDHRYAPLAIIIDGTTPSVKDLRRKVKQAE